MTLRERAVLALERKIPDSIPTFELEFQIEREMFGATFDYSKILPDNMAKYSPKEADVVVGEFLEHWADLFINKLEYSIIPSPGYIKYDWIKRLRKLVDNQVMIHHHGDGTFAIPDGAGVYEFSYKMADEPEELLALAEKKATNAIEQNKRLIESGIDCLILCDDYCFNNGPFISPNDFSVFIAPFLARIIEAGRNEGAYTIKHTDGNIMPILDQLVFCNPHAIHSIDPMAGVDIAEVKRLVGDKVCLCGNVNCALMQTGTEQEIIDSARYAIENGKPNGGYIFCTSNIPFYGMPVRSYELILKVWKEMRTY